MSDFKSVMKGGWHPKGKDGGKESWRGDFKGINQVAGWMGKGKDTTQTAREEHISRPLASLKDPSSFGPPPKNVNYHGGAALPNEITPHRGGLGAPLTQDEIIDARNATATPPVEEQEAKKPAPPPLPFRSDRTGLRTDNLPPPPVHKELREVSAVPVSVSPRPTPSLPPRLPSRQNTVEAPPPPYERTAPSNATATPTPILNQSAVDRLGKAGISVPGFGIGTSSESADTSSSTETKPWRAARSPYTAPSSGLSELQSRFAKMNNSSNTSPVNPPGDQAAVSPASGTTSPAPQTQTQTPSWQQTRTALTTANSAYKDPSSVSLADAQQAATTAQNAQRSAVAFRERHGETINAAQTRATQLNKKYNMTGRLNRFLEDANNAHDQHQQQQTPVQSSPTSQQQQQQQQQPQQPEPSNQWQTQQPVASPPPQTATSELATSISRKPPPPPPPKKPASMQAPPPVPLGTKPNFG